MHFWCIVLKLKAQTHKPREQICVTLKGETRIGALSGESNESFEIIFLRGRRLFRNDCLALAAGISGLILTGENGLLKNDKMQGKVTWQVNMSRIPSGGKPW